jgi:hypothetical protein
MLIYSFALVYVPHAQHISFKPMGVHDLELLIEINERNTSIYILNVTADCSLHLLNNWNYRLRLH